jgi:hypothetical protein
VVLVSCTCVNALRLALPIAKTEAPNVKRIEDLFGLSRRELVCPAEYYMILLGLAWLSGHSARPYTLSNDSLLD